MDQENGSHCMYTQGNLTQILPTIPNPIVNLDFHMTSDPTLWWVGIRYRTIFFKRFIQGLVLRGILKGQESKSWNFFEDPRRFRGPQKSENLNFLKRTNKSVDHKFKSFAIN